MVCVPIARAMAGNPIWSEPDILAIELEDGSTLSSDSKVLCYSALAEMLNRSNWAEMTDATWDMLEALIATAIREVTNDEA